MDLTYRSSTPFLLHIVVFFFAIFSPALSRVLSAQTHGQIGASSQAYKSVDPFIGTSGYGDVFPGATLPFGMVQWSPDTATDGWYRFDDKSVRGFSLTHLSGAGCPVFSDFPILPWLGTPTESPGKSDAAYTLPLPPHEGSSHPGEQAEPGYYRVQFSSGLLVELTVTQRTGLARIHFPAGQAHTLLFDAAANGTIDHPKRKADRSQIEVRGADTVTGQTIGGPFCPQRQDRYTVYFAAKVDRPADSFGVWSDDVLQPGGSKADAHRAGAYLSRKGDRAEDLLLKVGISFTSPRGAQANLDAESTEWDFDKMRSEARGQWTKRLDAVKAEEGTADQQRIFYTGLYHMLLAPNLFSDADGSYAGFDGTVHKLEHGSQYTNFSDWDTYRDVIQLQAWLFPKETSEMMQSLVRDARESGALPRWPVANESSDVMSGDSSPILLASAYAFGAKDFDAADALRYSVRGAVNGAAVQQTLAPERSVGNTVEHRSFIDEYVRLGYVPSEKDSMSVSRSLEYASSDFAISRLASALGDTRTAERFLLYAQRWKNVFDPAIGYMHPKLSDGTFLPGFDLASTGPRQVEPWYKEHQIGFEEANTFQYTWMVPFDYAGLFRQMGGTEDAVAKLDSFFTRYRGWATPYFNVENEPDFAAPYAYLFAREPWKTQRVVPEIMAQTFNVTPSGIPGNDDLGATSGVYVWGATGLYPEIPGEAGLAVGSPLFPKLSLALGNGSILTISRAGQGPYVKRLELNGQVYTRSWIPLSLLSAKGSPGRQIDLRFEMSEIPDKERGTKASELPPSFSATVTRP